MNRNGSGLDGEAFLCYNKEENEAVCRVWVCRFPLSDTVPEKYRCEMREPL